jgi:DNA repair ATPase RecN
LSLPDPNVVEHELESAVTALVNDYRWAYNLAHESPNTSEARVSGGDRPDPTAGAFSSQRNVRSKLRHVVNIINGAKKSLEKAHDALDDTFDQADRRSEPLNLITERVATTSEVTRARRAQERRQGRGEGHGVA